MNLVIKQRAFNALLAAAKWVESRNTPGTGDHWLDKVFRDMERRAQVGVTHAKCTNRVLAKHGYLCFTCRKNWIVVYKMEQQTFIVYRFIWAGKLA